MLSQGISLLYALTDHAHGVKCSLVTLSDAHPNTGQVSFSSLCQNGSQASFEGQHGAGVRFIHQWAG